MVMDLSFRGHTTLFVEDVPYTAQYVTKGLRKQLFSYSYYTQE